MKIAPLTLRKYSSPPPRHQVNARLPEDTVELSAAPKQKENNLAKTLGAMAALALTLASGTAQAEPQDLAVEQPTDTDLFGSLKSLGDKADDLADDLQTERTSDIGEYKLRYTPLDVDFKPKWNSGDPGLHLKGDFMETSLVLREKVGEQWTTTQGLRGLLRGEVSTVDDSELNLHLGAFKNWTGPVSDDLTASFDVHMGMVNRGIGENQGAGASLSFRQEVEGELFDFAGGTFDLYAESSQHVSYDFSTDTTTTGYSARVGLKRDFRFNFLGRKAKLSLSAGPRIKNDSDLEFKTKARLRL